MVSKTTELSVWFTYLDTAVDEKWIYIWGGQGERIGELTFGKVYVMESNDNKNFSRELKHLSDIILDSDFDLWKCRCVDCSGLGMYYLQDLMGILDWDHNAKALFKEGIVIDQAIRQPGDFVYKSFDSEGPQHVGYLIENDYVIESYGRDKGVIKRKFKDGKWTRVCRQPYFSYHITRKLKKGMSGDDVGQLQARLKSFGYDCGEVDNIFGAKTKEAVKLFQKDHGIENNTGNVGEKTSKALLFTWYPQS